MAMHLINKGHHLSVYNRTASKADELVAAGAKYMSPREIAQSCDYVFLMVGLPSDVQVMVLDSDFGILQHMKEGAYLIDHTTSTPSLAMEIAQVAKA